MPALQFKKDQMSSWATYSCVIAEKSLPGLEKQIKDTLHLTDMKDLKDIGKNGPLTLPKPF